MTFSTIPRTRDREQLLAWASRQKSASLSAVQASLLDEVYPDWSKTLDDRWHARIDAVEAFVAANDRLPKEGGDKCEDSCAVWLGIQRRNQRLSTERRLTLNKRLPGWDTPGESSRKSSWDEALDYVNSYFEATGTLPTRGSANAEVAFHARWLSKQRTTNLSPARASRLANSIAFWDEAENRAWNDQLEWVVRFVAENDRLPVKDSSDPLQADAGKWLRRQREATQLAPGREALLDEKVPTWRDTSTKAGGVAVKAWFERLDQCTAFFAEHGRRPRPNATNPEEIALHWWYKNAKASVLGPEQEAVWNAAGFSNKPTLDQVWAGSLDAACAFVAKEGRFPARTSSVSDERLMGRWLRHQRAVTSLLPARLEALNASLPGWRGARVDTWQSRFESCVEFSRTHGRFPSKGKTGPQEERKLAEWLRGQRRYADTSRSGLLDQRLPGWRGKSGS